LLLHPWPFNVRGLLNVLLLADQLCPPGTPLSLVPEVERVLEAEIALLPPTLDLPLEIAPLAPPSAPELPAAPKTPNAPPVAALPPGTPPRILLEAMLQEHRGRVSEIARRLGCKRQQLYTWFSHYQLSPESFR
jgi:DNA-binding NtrC family response regulator